MIDQEFLFLLCPIKLSIRHNSLFSNTSSTTFCFRCRELTKCRQIFQTKNIANLDNINRAILNFLTKFSFSRIFESINNVVSISSLKQTFLKNKYASTAKIDWEVPQGSMLGDLLFFCM